MDLPSAFISALMTSVAGAVTGQMNDAFGTQSQAIIVDYQGVRIGYQYQLWKVIEPSVCDDQRGNALEFSRCTLAAKALFNEACQYLQDQPMAGGGRQPPMLKNMYCAAAASFKPTVARLSVPDPAVVESALERAKGECNQLIAAALGSTDGKAARDRDKACGDYRRMKDEARRR